MRLGTKTGLLAFLMLFGAFLLGTGITGHVIGQSCCFGDDCPDEYKCTVAGMEEPAVLAAPGVQDPTLPWIGASIILLGSLLFYGETQKRKLRRIFLEQIG